MQKLFFVFCELLLALSAYAQMETVKTVSQLTQQNPAYNDQVTVDEGVSFLPFRKGEVSRKIAGANIG